ncbi:NAD(P)/FAD-dependent oxidoreductase [Aureitalea sp. L0-47]|uniref:NAD(P)/FAD-dependent oxidoreductase n=1 Tax=Aureitalea sp. L0-47 TaxID=2816962 RepID=UPI0022390FC6|nr:NAD(P)/FAD-dependent oxidoreductase [Aureitalea sp. L0-47]MCW5518623.1 NAD(P)/FAD-dependent oxidoreductase [Aureitalea sp. L0-47]
MQYEFDLLIIGGGAAGYFTAINAADMDGDLTIAILERGKDVLNKVKVSGGGRCNVTHAEFLPDELTQNYPRGEKELLGPFHRFMTGDTITWFQERGVELKIEADGRMFPVTDSSQTIIDCFNREVERLGIMVYRQSAVKSIAKEKSGWEVATKDHAFRAKKVVVATGSNTKVWSLLESLGHTIVPAVPSLFTFNIKDDRIDGLAGIATQAEVEVVNSEGKTLLKSDGPLLITHWGMSGPAILKLSAWGARILEPLRYNFTIRINWLDGLGPEEVEQQLKEMKLTHGKKKINSFPMFELPKRLWKHLVLASGISENTTWAELDKFGTRRLTHELTKGEFKVNGKSTFKEEFVTAGGVALEEVNFRTFESKLLPGMYFAGEVLNIDAITGGFNFQNAWTGGYLAAKAITV